MGLLKKIAGYIGQATAIVAGFGPIFTALRPQDAGTVQTVSADLAQIADIVMLMETAFAAPGSGAQKLQASTPAVAQIILKSSLLANHKIEKADLFQKGCASIASGVADVLNSLHADNVQVQDKAA